MLASTFRNVLVQINKNDEIIAQTLTTEIIEHNITLFWPNRLYADMRTVRRWFDSSQFLLIDCIVIATGLIPPSPLTIVSMMIMWEAACKLERILCGIIVKVASGKAVVGAMPRQCKK